MSTSRWPAIGVSGPPPPYSPDLAIADFYLCDRLNRELSGKILDGEEKALEASTVVLSELPKDEGKTAFDHWKERCQRIADHNGEFYPN
jgi:hypothetical protein